MQTDTRSSLHSVIPAFAGMTGKKREAHGRKPAGKALRHRLLRPLQPLYQEYLIT
jgi:hypothetical protein